MKIYGDIFSGNCYKLKLACALLSIPHEWVAIDILKRETLTESFLSINPAGKIPVLETDDGEYLTESNAILYYLARDTNLWPSDKVAQTCVLQWQFFEQYSHEPNIAVARFIKRYLNMPEARKPEYERKLKPGYRALDIMEKTLVKSIFLVGGSISIADLSLYAYTHVAHEGGFDLANYPGINRWLHQIETMNAYVSMNDE
jgi:glutathione S-transferase